MHTITLSCSGQDGIFFTLQSVHQRRDMPDDEHDDTRQGGQRKQGAGSGQGDEGNTRLPSEELERGDQAGCLVGAGGPQGGERMTEPCIGAS